ncbi:hypothetical protein KSS87_008660, partial [Heliosperma pusillum]
DKYLKHRFLQDHRQFQQRYYEFLDDFRSPDGPIFLQICGEYSCNGIANDYLSVLAKKFGAAIVSPEHRYYGKSLPFESHTTENLRYLSSKQALFDLASFRQYYQFPHLTCGSLASSAVVLAVYNFTEFDQQIGISAGPECKAALQEITQLVEERLKANEKEIKSLFGASELKVDGDFLFFLADAAVMAFQYGNPDKLCSPLVKAKKANQDLVAEYASYVKDFYIENFGASVKTYSQEHLKNSTVGEDSDDRLWWFQVCSEVAYFQVAPENDSIRSSKIDTRYHLDLCRNVFGGNVYPEVEATNLYYGGLKIAGSKIVFANGSQDPWRRASKQISSPGMPSYLITCHNCGHCSDVRGCPQSPVSIAVIRDRWSTRQPNFHARCSLLELLAEQSLTVNGEIREGILVLVQLRDGTNQCQDERGKVVWFGDSKGCSSPDAVNKIRQHITEHIDLWLSECQDVDGYWSAMKPKTLQSS